MRRRLTKKDFSLPTKKLAVYLLGKELFCETDEGLASGIIVETEAYLPTNDPACHAAFGKTPRNEVMFGPPGCAYVYFCYGNHWLFNVTSEHEGTPGAVLIRALEPLRGKELMKFRRPKAKNETAYTNGPGKLTAAIGITKDDNRRPLYSGSLGINDIGRTPGARDIVTTTRIGIQHGADLLLRFYLKNNSFISCA